MTKVTAKNNKLPYSKSLYVSSVTRWYYITVSDRALIFPITLLSQLQGWPGCQKIQFFFSQINLLSFCARIEPKLSKLQKTVRKEGFFDDFLSILTVF